VDYIKGPISEKVSENVTVLWWVIQGNKGSIIDQDLREIRNFPSPHNTELGFSFLSKNVYMYMSQHLLQ